MDIKSESLKTKSPQKFKKALESLSREFGAAPSTAVVLGSGFSSFCQELQNAKSLAANRIPGASGSSVEGHKGEIWKGDFQSHPLIVIAGRLHGYEGHSPEDVVFLLRCLRLWGVQKFILTNASGATHAAYSAGDLVLIRDHINFTAETPLRGKELFGGERFPDFSDPYSKSWREKIRKKHPEIKEGVYIGVAGPSYETASEIKMFHQWGADLVGMSTVWETIALHQMKAQVLGLSCVANLGTGVQKTPLTHQEVLESIQSAVKRFTQIMGSVLELS